MSSIDHGKSKAPLNLIEVTQDNASSYECVDVISEINLDNRDNVEPNQNRRCVLRNSAPPHTHRLARILSPAAKHRVGLPKWRNGPSSLTPRVGAASGCRWGDGDAVR
jgi:hypothetical protein